MEYVNDFGIDPNRGNKDAAGIDFYVPDASSWSAQAKNDFVDYAYKKGYTELINSGVIKTSEDYNKLLMYISHQFAEKDSMEFSDWEFKYWNEIDNTLRIRPLQSVVIPSGIRIHLADNTAGIFFNKSGIGIKGLVVKAQVIDKDYTGYVHCNLVNVSDGDINIKCGQKITQLVEMPVCYGTPNKIGSDEYFAMMKESIRGEGMAGSTGLYKDR